MPKIHALLVGIDQYKYPNSNLKGCVNDLNDVKAYLTQCYNPEIINLKTLIDSEATRANIIAWFDFFQNAVDGDICIFYFSGHGSTMRSPANLMDYTSNQILKSLVCHDSRVDSVDILNPELAYLIWKSVHGKKIKFIVITDCCHSGEVTRKIKNKDIHKNIKKIPESRQEVTLKELCFASNFESINTTNNFNLKRGDHIHLAACLSDQKAIEAKIGKEMRGIFTYHLIQVLKKHHGEITIENLIDKVRILVQSKIPAQTPNLFNDIEGGYKVGLLKSTFNTGKSMGNVFYDKSKGWILSSGILNSPLDEYSSGNVKISKLEDYYQFEISNVHASYSNLKLPGNHKLNRKKIYSAEVIYIKAKKFIVKLELFTHEEALLRKQYAINNNSFSYSLEKRGISKTNILILRQIEKFKYRIFDSANKNAENYLIYLSPINWEDELLNKLEKICRWKELILLAGNSSNILEDHISWTFETSLNSPSKSSIHQDNCTSSNVNNRKSIRLQYSENGSSYFNLKLTNTSQNAYWVSILYLADDYSITNKLLTPQKINPLKSVSAQQTLSNGDVSLEINVKVSKSLTSDGVKSSKEFIKIIASSDFFESNYYNQSSIFSKEKLRILDNDTHHPKLIRWQSKTLLLNIERI